MRNPLVLMLLFLVSCGNDSIAYVSTVHEVAEDYSDRVKRELEEKISELESQIETLESRMSGCHCAD